jgi:capsular exopolysaccharide synthesis family protein
MFEVYQSLYTNLKFMGVGSESKAICISSSIPSEGKSSTASNLAATAAYSGRKVLLIDCDMRKPSLHEIWDLGGRTGLSNVLIGECSFETAVHHGVFESLDVLTAGVRPPNPILLLESSNLSSLIQNAREKYDLIIIDTPPMNSVADALELRGIVDGLLLVVRPHTVDVACLSLTRDLLARASYNVFGLVVNAVRAEVDPESYSYSGYGYGYGYGGKQRDLEQERDAVKSEKS